ncbi:hypothetical protein BKA81DRAFT_410358 [Phyllosticta paracitricarpa]
MSNNNAAASPSSKSAPDSRNKPIAVARPPAYTRDSQAELTPTQVAVPAHPPNTPRQRSEDNLRSAVAGVTRDSDSKADPPLPSTAIVELLAGQTGKCFKVHRDLLINRSSYFRNLLSSTSAAATSPKASFPDLDEFAFALFVRWLYGASLRGPSDYASMQHYLCLYVLARRFRIERLQNDVLDLVRAYYRAGNMTAPAHRLEYLYDATTIVPATAPTGTVASSPDAPTAASTATATTVAAETSQNSSGASGTVNASAKPNVNSNPMRRFLVATAAYRYLCEREPRLSDAMRGVISRGGDLAVDFAEAMAALHQNQIGDVRKGSDCAFHEHKETPVCRARIAEAFE